MSWCFLTVSGTVCKHGFFKILSPQSILLVPSFPRMKSGNRCSIFCTSYLRNTYSEKHLLVAVPFYVDCETRKPLRKPLTVKTNEKSPQTVLFQIIY